MTAPTALEQLHRQIMWNRLLSVVEEQARTTTVVSSSFEASVNALGYIVLARR